MRQGIAYSASGRQRKQKTKNTSLLKGVFLVLYMPEIKCVINDAKAGKSYSKALEDHIFSGRKIGDKVSGGAIGLAGYELEITGGSDSAGIPMLKSLDMAARKRLILRKGFALRRGKKKSLQKDAICRRSVRGNQVSQFTAQLNLKVIQYGTKPITELWSIQPKEAAAPAEKKE